MGAERSQWQFPANEVGKVIGWSDEASPSNPSASKGLVNKGPFVEPDDIANMVETTDTDASGFDFVNSSGPLADSDTTLAVESVVRFYINSRTGIAPTAAADGDGDGGGTDIATELQSLMNDVSSDGGGEITLQRTGTGIYNFASAVTGKDNVTIRIAPGVRLDMKNAAGSLLLIDGAVGSEIAVVGDYGRGDSEFTTATAHGLTIGDDIHIVSPVNSLSVDAGSWRLGNGTVSLNYGYFAEFLKVAEVVSTTVFRTTTGCIFPFYPESASGLTDTERTGTTIKKVTPVSDFHWLGGEFLNVAGTGFARSKWAVDCSVQDAVVHRGSAIGATVSLDASLRCFSKGVRDLGDPSLVWDYDTLHGQMNRFRTVGSQDCGHIDYYSSYSAQAVDHTYSGTYQFANLRPYAEGGTTFRCYEGVTSHPGCYGERWERNQWLECFRNGAIIRGLRASVKGNLITSQTELVTDVLEPSGNVSVGVYIFDGHAKDAVVSENQIEGFRYAAGIASGSGSDQKFTDVRASIRNNDISRCYGGLLTDFTSTSDATLRQIDYSGNRHSFMERYVADLGAYSAGCNFDDNVLFGAFVNTAADTSAAFFNGTVNNPALTGKGNKWYRPAGSNGGITLRAVNVSSVTDTTTYPSGSFANRSAIEVIVESDISTKYTYGSTNYVQTKEFADGNAGLSNGLLSGTYTPTLTATTNVSASTAAVCNWLRVGNMVHVTGTLQATATATGQTTLGISFPIASTLSAATDCGGSGANFSANAAAGLIEGETANNRARFRFNATGTTSTQFGFSFMYRLL